ncbi:MAG: CDP-glucose 4,6-dehydratase [Lachnospiraceae bacterium]
MKGKRILITGHTGFKGAWLCEILRLIGAKVYGYSLNVPTSPSLYNLIDMDSYVQSCYGDIRDYDKLKTFFDEVQPEYVIHLAAQPLVRESYKNPRETYEINVMGTVNVCECVRNSSSINSFLNVTTDKVYLNREWEWGYRENDALDGFDPYSNSKSCSELVTHSYINSFFRNINIAVSTARAGNVIGGGDFASDRIIPDCYRAQEKGLEINVRNPYSVRPYQHVLDPLMAYLQVLNKQLENRDLSDYYNIGPDENSCITTGELVDKFCKLWGESATWKAESDGGPHEAGFLKLDSSKLRRKLGWKPVWNISEALSKTVEWYKEYQKVKNNADCAHSLIQLMDQQIIDFSSNSGVKSDA